MYREQEGEPAILVVDACAKLAPLSVEEMSQLAHIIRVLARVGEDGVNRKGYDRGLAGKLPSVARGVLPT